MSCRVCEHQIFVDGLTMEWFMDVETNQWDDVEQGWVFMRVYINFCYECGLDYRYKKNGKR